MPSRAVTSFLRYTRERSPLWTKRCQCPLGLLPHFYFETLTSNMKKGYVCQCPLGLLPHFYDIMGTKYHSVLKYSVNALSGCYLISTDNWDSGENYSTITVSMPSRAVTSFLPLVICIVLMSTSIRCQCPLGLLPHFYSGISFLRRAVHIRVSMPSRAVTSFLPEPEPEPEDDESECQCPLGLLPHFYSTLSKT